MEAAPALLLPHQDDAMEAATWFLGYNISRERTRQGCILKASSSSNLMDAGTPPWYASTGKLTTKSGRVQLRGGAPEAADRPGAGGHAASAGTARPGFMGCRIQGV